MEITGILLAVMESWPLQLTIDTAEGRRHVVLTMDTVMYAAGEETPVHHLRPGQRLRLEGRWDGSFRANRIELLEEAPPDGPAPEPDDEEWTDATADPARPTGAPHHIPGLEPTGPPSIPSVPPLSGDAPEPE